MNPLSRAIESLPRGRHQIADACGVKYQAVQKWETAGRLPRTEFSGETDHAGAIERETAGEVTKDELLQWSRDSWTSSAA